MMYSGIRDLIISDPSTNALVAGRVLPVYAPENQVFPYIVLRQFASSDTPTLDKKVSTTARMQFDIWSTQWLQCEAVELALGNLLRGFMGVLTDGTRIINSQRENIIDSFPQVSRQFRLTVEYELIVSEP